jgi:hypothetical protein
MARHSRQSEQLVRRFLKEHDAELYGYGMSHKKAAGAVKLHTGIRVTARYLRTLRALEPDLRWRGHAGGVEQGAKCLTGSQWNSLLLWIDHHANDEELRPVAGGDLALARRVAAAGIGVRPSLGNIREAVRLVRERRIRNRFTTPPPATAPFIKPTVGRIVHYTPSRDDLDLRNDGAPLAAVIAKVWSDSMVNLAVFAPTGLPRPRSGVRLLQPGEQAPDVCHYCEWMDFQKGQAAKTEQLEQLSRRSNPCDTPVPATPNVGELLESHFAPAPLIYKGEHSTIEVGDTPGAGGAYNSYAISVNNGSQCYLFTFQRGDPAVERNGILNEDLLRVVQHRLESFEKGPCACIENRAAIKAVAQALWWLAVRTDKRKKAGVEGKTLAIPEPAQSAPAPGAAAEVLPQA